MKHPKRIRRESLSAHLDRIRRAFEFLAAPSPALNIDVALGIIISWEAGRSKASLPGIRRLLLPSAQLRLGVNLRNAIAARDDSPRRHCNGLRGIGA